MGNRVTVTARDHPQLARLITSAGYGPVAEAVGCARQTLSSLVNQPGRQVTLGLARRIEAHFDREPGGLFEVVFDPELRPYLPVEVAA